MKLDALVIGGGPAGIAAAVQLTRMGFKAVVVEKNRVGGLMANANRIENYPGFPDGISGKELAELFRKQLKRFKVPVLKERALQIRQNKQGFGVKTSRKSLSSPFLLLACGSQGARLGAHGEAGLAGQKVFYEVEALPPLKKGQTVCVAGSGDIAFDYALNLARRKIRCTLLLRGPKPKCIPLLARAVRRNPFIEVRKDTEVTEIADTRKKVALQLRTKGKKGTLEADYVLVAAGRKPYWGLLPAAWRKRLRKNLHSLEKRGLFLAGDMNPENGRHIGIAVGDGLRAAIAIGRRLSCR